jgi:hypothetical protein
MPDGLALPALALIAVGLVALALVWPQGQGARSPAPFGHPVAATAAPLSQIVSSPLSLRGPQSPPRPPAPSHRAAAPAS